MNDARKVEFDIRVELWPIVEARAKELALTPEAFCALQPENLLLKHGHDPAKIGAGFKVSVEPKTEE
jgi:hypothetical protein